MVRTVAESLFQAADPSMPLSDLAAELVAMDPGKATKVQHWQEHLARAKQSTVGDLLKLTLSQLETLGREADTFFMHQVCICIGSIGTPHVFATWTPSDDQRPHPETDAVPALIDPTNMDMLPATAAVGPTAKSEVTKGGTLTEVAESLKERRPYMYPDAYFPPQSFDIYHNAIRTGEDKGLRMLIVQEIEEVCGDLYPSMNERSTILTAIEQFVGLPANGGHWDNWRIKNAEINKKHKGAAISDLEKARRKPSSYGVSGRCVPSRMRPARPRRSSAPPSAALGGSFDSGQRLTGGTSFALGTVTRPPSVSLLIPPADPSSAGGQLADLDTPDDVNLQVNSMKDALEAKKKVDEAAKAAKLKAAKETRAAKAAAKAAVTAATKAATKAKAATSGSTTAYERKRDERVKRNEEVLAGLGLTSIVPLQKKKKGKAPKKQQAAKKQKTRKQPDRAPATGPMLDYDEVQPLPRAQLPPVTPTRAQLAQLAQLPDSYPIATR